ncbi:DNA sulfur modification protein DndB [Vibrio splendidus]
MSTNYVPAIKAKMGDWIYYITKMKFGEVAKQVELAEKIHPNKELDEQIQRNLSNRVEAMTEFLLKEKQRFYGSLVVAVYKGNPMFHPIRIDEEHGIVDRVNHSFGLLQMDGSQTFFALDGQHRLESIKEACEENIDLKEEEISVIVLKHASDKEGMIRTRRLFTKLNRYAKPTDEKTNISIDEDDAIAITTRQLVRENAYLKKFTKINSTGKQISTSKADNKYFSTMQSVYEVNIELAKAYNGGLEVNKDFLSHRPEDEFLESLFDYLNEIWCGLFEQIAPLQRIASSEVSPGSIRGGDNGGNVWVRPIFQLVIAEVIQRALLSGKKLDEVISSLNKLPQSFDEEPWLNVIYNKGTNRVTGAKNERKFLVEAIIVFSELGSSPETKKTLREKYGTYFDQKSRDFPKMV